MAHVRSTLSAFVLIAACLLFVATIPLSEQTSREAEQIAVGARDFVELRTRFEMLAREKGAVHAFEILRTALLPPNTDVHLLGHAIGDILYEQRGLEGITECTQDFRNACSHTIVIGALRDFGDDALDHIRDVCKRAPGGTGAYTMCYHGLGHGVLAYHDYDLEKTVAMCAQTGTEAYLHREAIECFGGAIMELISGGGHNPDAWSAARERYLVGPLDPCMTAIVPEYMRGQCLNYLTPHLWEFAGIDQASPDSDALTDSFALCDLLPTSASALRDMCGGGFGKEFIPLIASRDSRAITRLSNVQLAEVADWCAHAPKTDLQHACVRHALSSLFWGGENDPDVSFRFCAAIPDAGMQTACYKHLNLNINLYTFDEQRHTHCLRLPEPYITECLATPDKKRP